MSDFPNNYSVGDKIIVRNPAHDDFHCLVDGSVAVVVEPGEYAQPQYLRVEGQNAKGVTWKQWLREVDVVGLATPVTGAQTVEEAQRAFVASFMEWAQNEGIWNPERFVTHLGLTDLLPKVTYTVSFEVEAVKMVDDYDVRGDLRRKAQAALRAVEGFDKVRVKVEAKPDSPF